MGQGFSEKKFWKSLPFSFARMLLHYHFERQFGIIIEVVDG